MKTAQGFWSWLLRDGRTDKIRHDTNTQYTLMAHTDNSTLLRNKS